MTSKCLEFHASLIVLGLAAATGAARADKLDDILSAKVLKCGTFSDVPPFAAADPTTRERAGFDLDLCTAIAQHLGVKAEITPLSVEARVPEVKLGRVDVTIANLAHTLGRAEQIQFSDPYSLAKEMLAVNASDPGTTKADFKDKRLAFTKGSTCEKAIRMNGSDPLTFQDTGSAFMAVRQNKARGMVKGEPALPARINETLRAMDEADEINSAWDKWLGQGTGYKMTRTDKVVPLAELKFEPIP